MFSFDLSRFMLRGGGACSQVSKWGSVCDIVRGMAIKNKGRNIKDDIDTLHFWLLEILLQSFFVIGFIVVYIECISA